jgi:hypothetical protein
MPSKRIQAAQMSSQKQVRRAVACCFFTPTSRERHSAVRKGPYLHGLGQSVLLFSD